MRDFGGAKSPPLMRRDVGHPAGDEAGTGRHAAAGDCAAAGARRRFWFEPVVKRLGLRIAAQRTIFPVS